VTNYPVNRCGLPQRVARTTAAALAVSTVAVLFAPAGEAQSVQLNQSCVVAVLNRTVQVNNDGSWVLPNVPANFGMVRARATCVNNGITSFGQSALFSLGANATLNLPHIQLGNPSPIPTAITISAQSTSLTTAGATAQLSVMAGYSSGPSLDITAASTGTQYNVSNPAIATVSSGGLVTAVSSGTALIQAVNEGAQGIITIQVSLAGATIGGIPVSWAIANGLDPTDPALPYEDPDNDGLTNLQEYQAGTNPNNPDTDGDGLTDGQEVLIYHTNPLLFSTDGTGIPDGIEVETGTLGGTLSAKLAAALSSLTVTPSTFVLAVNSIQGQASQQLAVTGHLIDGKTTLNLTSTGEGTNYSSSNLSICNFGAPDGNVFAGSSGTCTITVTNNGFTAMVTATVTAFTPTSLSYLAIPGFANAVAVNGNYAYVAAGSAGLQVVDVTDRTNPQIVASLALAGNSNDVRLLSNFAYVAGGSAGLQAVDITNPLAPVLRGTLNTNSTALDVTVRGSTAYVANSTNLFIADVTNPAAMSQIGTLSLNGYIQGVDVDPIRHLAVVTAGTSGVYVVDVTNPAAPALLGTTTTGDARDAAIGGTVAYIADYVNSTTSVDISNPATPTVLSNITDPNLGGFLQDILLSGTFALAADVKFVNGIPITDISNPSSLQARAILNFPQRDDNGQGIAADATYVYLATEHNSLNKFGSTGDSRLYIGQYLALQDLFGIPPTASITSPMNGATVTQGASLPIIVNASDDVAVAAVNFLVNGQVVFTSTAQPYQFNYHVPTDITTLTIGATAVDLGANVGTATNVVLNVIPDPGTTVTGTVVDMTGAPVSGATVTVQAQFTATTQADGTFSITGVPTVQGNIIAGASVTVNGMLLTGTSASLPPVAGGTTNVGTITVTQSHFETNLGTLVAQCDDCWVQQTIPFPFTYFGQTYTSVYVNNNGNLSFTYGDYVYTPSITYFTAQPRIAAFWDDLIATELTNPNDGLYINNTFSDHLVVTWYHQQIYCCTGDDTMQLTLFNNGQIQFAYNGISTISGDTSPGVIVGITPGGNVTQFQTDYVSNPQFSTTGPTTIFEFFVDPTPTFNLDQGFVTFTPNASGGYDVSTIPPPPVPEAGVRGTVQGSVTGADGKPIPKAKIRATSSRDLHFVGTTTADANGHYSLSVPLGGLNLVATVNGKVVAKGGGILSNNRAPLTLNLVPTGLKKKSAAVKAAKQPGK